MMWTKNHFTSFDTWSRCSNSSNNTELAEALLLIPKWHDTRHLLGWVHIIIWHSDFVCWCVWMPLSLLTVHGGVCASRDEFCGCIRVKVGKGREFCFYNEFHYIITSTSRASAKYSYHHDSSLSSIRRKKHFSFYNVSSAQIQFFFVCIQSTLCIMIWKRRRRWRKKSWNKIFEYL